MDSETTKRVMDTVEALAKKFGTTAEYLWPRLVHYTWASALTDVVLASVLFTIAVIANLRWLSRCAKKCDETKGDEQGLWIFFCVVLVILLIVSSITLCVTLSSSLPAVIAPEGATINQILTSK